MNGIQENQKSESAQNAIVHIGIKPKLRKRKGKFYTYVYLDPRKPGKFVFGKYEFEYEPFYVGKGSGRRCKVFCQHIKHNPFLKRKLKIFQKMS